MNQAPSRGLNQTGLSHEPQMPNNVYSEFNLQGRLEQIEAVGQS
jgi:hypothetical protein